ncbi:MAG: DUF1926 domain-containing protein [Acidobacteria bacterium]|nr:DUF1926 domain-containing protein [Acidobacteriota bacterium]
MPKVHLALVIHAHQPVGNFDHVIEDAYQKSYLPFVKTLANHSKIKLALHFTGSLFAWFKLHHPDYLQLLAELVAKGQIELISGGFYEPILAILPYKDRCEQIYKLNHFLKTELGYEAKGMWTAERVWESNLVSAISETGIKYTILDDTHFAMAGLRDNQLFGYYITEEQGQTLKLVPSSMRVRYLIPFADPQETIAYLRGLWETAEHDLLVAMGDDTEKFGVWPKTYQLCYKKQWLDRFYQAIAKESDWLETVKLGDYLEQSEPNGQIYLPTASYAEMMEWSLPAKVSQEFVDLKHMLGDSEPEKKLAQYLQGGYWRNFLVKYRESNLIHKKMLQVSQRLHRLYQYYHRYNEPICLTQSDNPKINCLKEAYDYLLQGECNDAFWHGVFGGLYAPHLRSTSLMALIKAEHLLDKVEFAEQTNWITSREFDFDGDGINEVEIHNSGFAAVYDNKEGGLSVLDFKTRNFSLINSLQRKEEAYHQRVKEIGLEEAAEELEANSELNNKKIENLVEKTKEATQLANNDNEEDDVETIHGIAKVKEKGLDKFLVYDKYPRNSFSVYALATETSLSDFATQQLDGKVLLAQSGHLTLTELEKACEFTVKHTLNLAKINLAETIELEQTFIFQGNSDTITSKLFLKDNFAGRLAVEFNINLLAGDAHDRYFRFGDEQHRLNWQGVVKKQDQLSLTDEYFRLAVKLNSNKAVDWWIYPVFSVSQSEEGFERVYQGSSIIVVLPANQANTDPIEISLTAIAI